MVAIVVVVVVLWSRGAEVTEVGSIRRLGQDVFGLTRRSSRSSRVALTAQARGL